MQVAVCLTANGLTQQVLTDLAAIGINTVRLLTPENLIETSSTTYNWTLLDTAINLCVANKFQFIIPMMTFQSANVNNLDATCGLPTVYAYETYGQLVIQRYYGTPGFLSLEMGNEEFSNRSMSGACQSGATYAAIAQTVYPYLKALAPNLLLGACAQTNFMFAGNAIWCPQWYNQFFSTITGQGPYIDYLNVHFYANSYGPNNNVRTLDSVISQIKTACSSGGYPNLPIWFTEFGWHRNIQNTGPTTFKQYTDAIWEQTVPEGVQAQYIIQTLNVMKSDGIAMAIIYEFAENYTSYDIAFRQAHQQLYWWLGQQKGLI